MNGLRNPQAWRKLRRAPLRDASPEEEETFLQETLEELLLPVEWDAALRPEERREISRQFFSASSPCVAWSLEIGVCQQGYGVVLEPDRVRILRDDEVLRFWKRLYRPKPGPGRTVVEK